MSTQLINAFSTNDAVGNREEIHDAISMLTPHETPFMSLIGTGKKLTSTNPKWQTDSLPLPSLNNLKVEGYEYTYDATDPTVMVGTHTQISDKSGRVTLTQEAVDKAGRKSDLKREIKKKGKALKVDMEAMLIANRASVAGANNTKGETAGFAAWLETGALRGSGGADGGYNQSTGLVDAASNGTQRAFTKALLDEMIKENHEAGGDADVIMGTPYHKQLFSAFMSDANVASFRTQMKGKEQGTLYGAADVYVSDFGTKTFIPNRQMARAGADVARNVFLIDKTKASVNYLRPITMTKPTKTGDALNFVLVTEYALKVENELAHGVIADTFGLDASN